MSIEEDESVNNKEISLLKKIIDENDVLKGRTIYTDDVGIGLPQCIFLVQGTSVRYEHRKTGFY